MATPAENVAQINTLMGQASAAVLAGDMDGAHSYALAAYPLAAGIPDTEWDGMGTKWDRAAIQAVLDRLVRSQSATAGIQTIKRTRQRPTL